METVEVPCMLQCGEPCNSAVQTPGGPPQSVYAEILYSVALNPIINARLQFQSAQSGCQFLFSIHRFIQHICEICLPVGLLFNSADTGTYVAGSCCFHGNSLQETIFHCNLTAEEMVASIVPLHCLTGYSGLYGKGKLPVSNTVVKSLEA